MGENRKSNTLMFMFIFLIAITFVLNKWVTGRINQKQNSLLLKTRTVKHLPIDQSKRKLVKIDPLNDQLAPVPKTKSKPVDQSENKTTEPKPIYEVPLDSPIFLQ